MPTRCEVSIVIASVSAVLILNSWEVVVPMLMQSGLESSLYLRAAATDPPALRQLVRVTLPDPS
jgi:hypothetical protein